MRDGFRGQMHNMYWGRKMSEIKSLIRFHRYQMYLSGLLQVRTVEGGIYGEDTSFPLL